MEKNLLVRDARDDERSAIQAVTLTAYAEYATIMPGPFWEAYRQQLLVTLDEEGPVERIVAEHDGTIVGSILLYPSQANAYTSIRTEVSSNWPEVRLLAVMPTVRGQGIGMALMDECEQHARRSGATTLGLHTLDIMKAALRLYERRGFIRVPELDFYPVQGVLVKSYRRSLYSLQGLNEETT
jgi:GNAT superfamily N-acetyltransferase